MDCYFNCRKASWDSVNFFNTHFPKLLCFSENEGDRLYDEFVDYKSLADKEFDLNKALLCSYDDGTNEYHMDVIWYMLQNLKLPIGNNYSFRLLFKVAKIVPLFLTLMWESNVSFC